jgi:glycosyltransferase involved in cell wall biosynthesis
MNLIQLTPGAGAMYCGNCFRDNALVLALRQMGHDVTMVPLYLPLTLDDDDQSAGKPIFFGGINVYFEQKSNLFRKAPNWLRHLLSSRKLLAWAGGRTAKTRATDVGDILLSMLRGEEGRQARDLEELIAWLKNYQRPDAVFISNALLIGMARRLKAELQTRVVCTLQGEDSFLDALPDSHRDAAWKLLAEKAADVDVFIAPSHYFSDLMARRLGLPGEKMRVVYNGISLEPFQGAERKSQTEKASAPVLGYFARMCKDKGLDTFVEAYIHVKQRGNVPRLKLHIGGSCGPGDEPFVKSLRVRLAEAGYIGEVSFSPNLSRAEKLAFLQALTVFSVPARYGEAFGMYLIEAMAAGVPAVQPRTAAFPELIEATGGGVLCEPENPKALADAIEQLLLNPQQARALGEAGRKAVFERFSAEAMAKESLRVLEGMRSRESHQGAPAR